MPRKGNITPANRAAVNREFQRNLKARKRARLERAWEHREKMRDFYSEVYANAGEGQYTAAGLRRRVALLGFVAPSRATKAQLIEALAS